MNMQGMSFFSCNISSISIMVAFILFKHNQLKAFDCITGTCNHDFRRYI